METDKGISLIYLDKCGDDGDGNPDSWIYYRIAPAHGLGAKAGEHGSTIRTCRVTWPALKDIEPISDTPGTVALDSAYPYVNKILEQWGIDRERSILIGIVETKAE